MKLADLVLPLNQGLTRYYFRTSYGDNINHVDGWLYEEVLDIGVTRTYYIYSDFRSVIRGHFRNNKLAFGYESKIVAYR